MALELIDGSIFLHLPRTGGTFVTAVLRRLRLVKRAIGNKHDCPGVIPMNMRVPHHVFIRHPYDWIRSVYAYQVATGWPTWPKNKEQRWWHPFREICNPPAGARETFNEFLSWVVVYHPGFVTRTFTKFADWPCSIVGKTEHLDTDLRIMLREMGVKGPQIHAAMISARDMRNSYKLPPEPSEAAMSGFLNTEATAIQRWFYGQR